MYLIYINIMEDNIINLENLKNKYYSEKNQARVPNGSHGSI